MSKLMIMQECESERERVEKEENSGKKKVRTKGSREWMASLFFMVGNVCDPASTRVVQNHVQMILGGILILIKSYIHQSLWFSIVDPLRNNGFGSVQASQNLFHRFPSLQPVRSVCECCGNAKEKWERKCVCVVWWCVRGNFRSNQIFCSLESCQGL